MKNKIWNILFCLPFFLTQSKAQISNATAAALQTELGNIISDDNLIGLTAAIMLEDGTLWTGTSGISHAGQPITKEMLFGIGSITKTFTATTILSIYEEGLLELDDPISDYLPDFDNINPDITIRQLLQHTSGVYDYVFHPDYEDAILGDLTKIWEPEETLNQFVNAPVFPAGQMYEYSNTNYILLGMIVKSITNNLLSEEMTARIFEPANLDSTFLDIEQDHYGFYAHMWADLDGSGTLQDLDALGLPREAAWSSSWADGAIVATAADIARFSHALFVEQNILTESTLSEMTDFSATNNEYGLGVFPTNSNCENWIGHNGELIYSSEWAFFETDGTSIAILYNQVVNGFLPLQHVTALCEILKNATSTDDLTKGNDLVKIFPNPAKNVLQISIPSNVQNVEVQIFSADGKLVNNSQVQTSEKTLNISNLNAGSYFLKIIGKQLETVEKLVVLP